MMQFKIDSFDAVNDFLFSMYERCGKIFDPAEEIKNLKDKNGAALFNEEESDYLDNVMMDCFIFCVLNDLNIYTLVNMVGYDIYHLPAAA